MGAITYDPEATQAKREKEMSKYQYLQEVGFQIRGMRVNFKDITVTILTEISTKSIGRIVCYNYIFLSRSGIQIQSNMIYLTRLICGVSTQRTYLTKAL